MAAETGSGKTGAFCLPVLQIVWETLKDFESGKMSNSSSGHHQPCMFLLIFVTNCFVLFYSTITFTAAHWALSLFDRGRALAVTPDGLRCQSREQKEWHGCRANKGIQGKDKYFFEAIVTDEGLCRVGWSTTQVIILIFY